MVSCIDLVCSLELSSVDKMFCVWQGLVGGYLTHLVSWFWSGLVCYCIGCLFEHCSSCLFVSWPVGLKETRLFFFFLGTGGRGFKFGNFDLLYFGGFWVSFGGWTDMASLFLGWLRERSIGVLMSWLAFFWWEGFIVCSIDFVCRLGRKPLFGWRLSGWLVD